MYRLDSTMSSFKSQIYTKRELDIRMEIQGIRTSKRMLYDNNLIIRKPIRPDDKMNEYDVKLDSLENKLKNFK